VLQRWETGNSPPELRQGITAVSEIIRAAIYAGTVVLNFDLLYHTHVNPALENYGSHECVLTASS
jgi:hypothetical protein